MSARRGGGDARPRRATVGIVADDLTGAGDCAVKFAEAGWEVDLELAGGIAPLGPLSPGAAVAVTTDVRACAQADAARRTGAAVTALMSAGAERLYLKIDSTLRGSVRGQIEGALEACSAARPGAFVLLCPAYPAMGRTVVGGELRVRGVVSGAVAAVGAQPVTLSGASLDADVALIREAGLRSRVLLLDAAGDDELDRLAEAMERLGPVAIGVGSAGLAGAIARRAGVAESLARQAPRLAAPVLIAVSSRHPVTTAQLEVLVRELGADPRVRLVTTPRQRVRLAAPAGTEAADRLVANRFADEVAQRVLESPVGALVLVGGDGALAVLTRLGAESVRVHGSAAEGIPVGVVNGGALDGVAVVTKSGGFGEPATLHELVRRVIEAESSGASNPSRGGGAEQDMT